MAVRVTSPTLKVFKDGAQWRVVPLGHAVSPASAGGAAYGAKAEAVAAAKAMLVHRGGRVQVQALDGRTTCLVVLGGQAARRLNALEGVAPSQDSRHLIREVAGKTLRQRRDALRRHFHRAESA